MENVLQLAGVSVSINTMHDVELRAAPDSAPPFLRILTREEAERFAKWILVQYALLDDREIRR